MSEIQKKSCIDCGLGNCDHMDSHFPDFCVTTHLDQEIKEEALSCYDDPENEAIMRSAAKVEYENYGRMTRVEEIAAFCKEMGYKKIGIATCAGLLREAGTFARILRHHDFEVFGMACKAGCVPKTDLDLPKEYEAVGKNICNPILQAKMLNAEHTDFNVVIGLCVGHDSLFYKYSEAPVTTLVTKDRVLGHNPCVALYQTGSYYKKLLK